MFRFEAWDCLLKAIVLCLTFLWHPFVSFAENFDVFGLVPIRDQIFLQKFTLKPISFLNRCSVNGREKSVLCTTCHKEFATKRNLTRHKQRENTKGAYEVWRLCRKNKRHRAQVNGIHVGSVGNARRTETWKFILKHIVLSHYSYKWWKFLHLLSRVWTLLSQCVTVVVEIWTFRCWNWKIYFSNKIASFISLLLLCYLNGKVIIKSQIP